MRELTLLRGKKRAPQNVDDLPWLFMEPSRILFLMVAYMRPYVHIKIKVINKKELYMGDVKIAECSYLYICKKRTCQRDSAMGKAEGG